MQVDAVRAGSQRDSRLPFWYNLPSSSSHLFLPPTAAHFYPDSNMTKSQLIYKWLSGVDDEPTHQLEPLGKI